MATTGGILDLVDRLASHRTFTSVPRAQLEWLATHGHLRTLNVGEVLTHSTGPVAGMYIVLAGLVSISVNRAAGPRKVMEWHPGDVTGVLPYSRIKSPPGDVVAEQPTEILMVDRSLLPEMIQACHELTEVLVHVMLDRTRVFKAADLNDEKLMSLGRLSAGLAHELNNPASAVARSASTLRAQLATFDATAKGFCSLPLAARQHEAVIAIRNGTLAPASAPNYSPIELSDREDAFARWFDAHAVRGCDPVPLAESSMAIEGLDQLAEVLAPGQMGTVLCYLSEDYVMRRLAYEIETAATRIHTLVSAVKGFTYMDQATIPTPVDVVQGLSDTLTVMRSKARGKSVSLELDAAPNLPRVDGFGGELNQVWANLIANAIDAVPRNGIVKVTAAQQGNDLIVQVIDNGPGIPPEIQGRIFDPFFTTKGVGEGTGIGLDTARGAVQRHNGEVTFTTGPQGTTFRVSLPLNKAARPRLE